jgi:streptogramin lyase
MIPKAKQQVSPQVTAVVILAVLIAIQWLWWQGLVAKPKPTSGPQEMGGAGPPAPGPPTILGRKEAITDTLAGMPEAGDADGAGHRARFDSPVGLALDAQGNLYVADSRNHKIKRLSPTGKTETIGGCGVAGAQDGAAAQAQFYLPCGVAVGEDGSVYVADTGNHRIRRIKDGQVTTLAGSEPGFAEGQGASVKFNAPVAVTYAGGTIPGLYVADSLNRRIRVLDLSGKISGGWTVPAAPTGVFSAPLIVAAPQASALIAGGKTWKAIPIDLQGQNWKQEDFTLKSPIAACAVGEDWFVIDSEQCCVFLVRNGKAEVWAGRCNGPKRLPGWADTDGHHAFFGQLGGIVADGKGTLYVSDTSNNCIRRITLANE